MIEDQVEQFLKEEFYRYIYFPSFARLRRAQHEGHLTIILSNSPSFIVGPIARYLGVPLWSASEYKVDKKGVLEAVKSILVGEGKADYLKRLADEHGIDMSHVYAYSDSPLDLPFLDVAGTPVVVNPTKKMRQISSEKSWEVI